MPLGDLPVRHSGTHVRRQGIRRASAGLRLRAVQIYALAFMALAVAAMVSLGSSNMFAAKQLEVHGATFTGDKTVQDIVRIGSAPNLFRLRTDRIIRELEVLPAVEAAHVEVRLPNTIVVTLIEREPKLIWVVGTRRYVVDSQGLLFGEVDPVGNPVEPILPSSSASPEPSSSLEPEASTEPTEEPSVEVSADTGVDQERAVGATRRPLPEAKATAKATPKPTPKPSPNRTATPRPTPTPLPTVTFVPPPSLVPVPAPESDDFKGSHAVNLPVVFDRRESAADLTLGGYVDPIALDAAYRLGQVSPADIGSHADKLAIVVDDGHGFTLSSIPEGWVAEFGFYTETLRKDTVIPTQVRDLRSALDHFGESKVAWIFLMSDISESHIDTVIMK